MNPACLLCRIDQVCRVTQNDLEDRGLERNSSCSPIENNAGIELKTLGAENRTCSLECATGHYDPSGGFTLSCAVQNDDQEFGKWNNEVQCLSA